MRRDAAWLTGKPGACVEIGRAKLKKKKTHLGEDEIRNRQEIVVCLYAPVFGITRRVALYYCGTKNLAHDRRGQTTNIRRHRYARKCQTTSFDITTR